METKTITIRIPEDVEKYLTRNGDKINPEVIIYMTISDMVNTIKGAGI